MQKFEKYSKWVMALIFAVIVIAVYKTFDNFNKVADVIKTAWSALAPFVIGFVIAYIFNMPINKIDAVLKKSKNRFLKKNSKPISITSVYLISILLLLIVIRSIVPALYRNMVDLYYNVPRYFDETISALVKWQKEHNITLFELDEVTATNTFNSILSRIDITQFSKYAQGVVKITSGVVNFMIGAIASVYMLIEKERIIALGKRLCSIIFSEKTAKKIIRDVAKINEIFSKYIFCLLLDAVMMTVLATVILSLLKVKYAIILGALIGICNLIPYFGAIIAGVSSVLITLITGGLLKAVWTAIALAILQQVDGNFIGPKIMGEVLDISPLWIIFAVTLGGGLFGVGGMVISVPIFMVIKMILAEVISQVEQKKASAQPKDGENE
ncbi:MAG: AI-2E family transporter [Clostridia bacterium]|nr:AI-2E family transporter [Clostridia bacterium]